MNLYEFIGRNSLFGLEVTLTPTGFTYQTHQAYRTENLAQYWNAMRTGGPNGGTGIIKIGAPELDATPLWTTDTYSVFPDAEQNAVGPRTVDFTELQKQVDFSDHAMYNVYAPWQSVNVLGNFIYADLVGGPDPVSQNEIIPEELINKMIFQPNAYEYKPDGSGAVLAHPILPLTNMYAVTMGSKMHPVDMLWHHTQAVGRMISIIVPFANSPISDWSLVFKMPAPGLLKINSGEQTTIYAGGGRSFISTLYPGVKFKNSTATVTADGFVDLEFQLANPDGTLITDRDATVYLKTNAGMLNKQVVTTKNGVGTVRLIASHLTTDDVAKVSCGFKFFSGTDDCMVTVQ